MNEQLKELRVLAEDISVLYVEDNLLLRQNVEQLLQKLFTNVFVAEDGLEGYQIFTQHKPKLVITDINIQGESYRLKEKKESGIINSDIYKFGAKSSNKTVEKQEVV